jgi:hypothetical protein
MSNENASFEKLDNEFNIPVVKQENSIKELDKNELVVKPEENVGGLENKDFLQTEIKEVITNGKKVLETLQKDIKIGSPPRAAEVYAKLMSSTIEGLRELRELDKTIADIKIRHVDENKPKTSVNISMTGKELLQMIKDAQSNSQMTAINTDFKVEDQTNESTR